MKREEFYFDSRDGKSKIRAVRYMPDTENVSGVLQIIHGMAEHIERYEEFARFFTDRNFVVVGEDHLGHGKSVGEGQVQGYFCSQDPATVVVRDSHRLKKMTQQLYPGVPYYIAGHSMGSFMLRNYIVKYGTGIDGAVIMGTGMQPSAVVKTGKLVSRIIKLFGGAKRPSKFIDKVSFGKNNQKVENPKTEMDWLTRDDAVVSKYLADPDCGFVFTANGFGTLFELIDRACNTKNIDKVPKELPVFFVAGDKDPVGEYGAGVQRAYEAFKEAGVQDVEIKLYPESRHEIINDFDKETVMNDIYNWIQKQISKKCAE